ncbi:sigma-54 dependent transcriptional regulator [Dyella nitratireducens]|uniref:Sigma-54-dependent Fis family transcriptional regulator n=1 Tax=Dyella nitratireducens TaxID=1849580 RepID=A0ABQ1FRA5_9GAMM|nr:sigma-54-dependent Fis family transcriptional regulator [Dyella nitratireducens]GGA27599.1 sigma-54-dependent Fis family transcriptional regulator [Dyella nitratireducens]GLQ43392.1 sigma-54-dependent Fis family transcriptional regulator [Dyella nitratireducens]
MPNSNVLIIESNGTRADIITSAMQFMGFFPQRWDASLPIDSITHEWRAVYIGGIEDEALCEQLLASLEVPADQLLVLVGSDSPQLERLTKIGSPYAAQIEVLDFPLRYERLAEAVRRAPTVRVSSNPAPLRLVGSSLAMGRVNALIRQVSPFDSSVLVLGESGTGKEMVARAIHDCSPRRDKPFVAINCGAIPAELLESELFGHEKGAFTGAISTRKGRFEMAEGGTLFLDEIGDMSLPMQVKLLRVLQERMYERVGSNRTQRCDVRIIAATHRNLEVSTSEGRFREDLYYRLSVFPLEMPPLRERLEDMPELIAEFNQRLQRRGLQSVRFSGSALQALRQHTWPGNVRELSNLVERLAILYPNGEVRASDLPEKYRGVQPIDETGGSVVRAMLDGQAKPATTQHRSLMDTDVLLPEGGVDLKDHLADIEVGLIRQALDITDGVVAHAAKLLRMQRTTLVEKLRKYGLQAACRGNDASPENSGTAVA